MKQMIKIMPFVACLLPIIAGGTACLAARAPDASNYMGATAYDSLYPMMNNKMRTRLNPGVTPSQSQNPIATLVRTADAPTAGRRVVSRSATGGAVRSATNGTNGGAARAATGGTQPTSVARMAAMPDSGGTPTANSTSARRVVARGNNAARNANRGDNSYAYRADTPTSVTNSTTESISSGRCLTDYTQCMNDYCERKSTSYNRCYCSAKLAQIDSEYQPAIDKLIKQILAIKGGNHWTDAEMKAYWDKMVGQYTGDNSWTNLDNALDINWADTESRVRGQQAFATGHEYCVQHLRGCYYMAANMRDAYRSEIARDCAIYETSLQKIKNAAESIVESYSE